MNRRKEIEGTVLNFSAVFVLPMVNIHNKHLPNNLINSYINDDYQIVLIFDRNIEDISFNDFLEYTKSTKYYAGYQEDIDEVIIYLNIEDHNKANYDLFKEGKYSQFSEEYKKVICQFHGKKTIQENYTVTPYNVIYPQEFKKKQIAERLYDPKDIKDVIKVISEVLDKPDLSKEQYKPLEQLLNQRTIQIC